jgi:pyruvate/2-oxoglutarate dehydrogenase complex dihydrolipoamide acyltransferase (E2) component
MDEERHDAPRRPATERADELLSRVGQTAGIFASLVGIRVARIAAFAREEAEDMWAEARSMRQQAAEADTNGDVTSQVSEGTEVSERSRSDAEEREPSEGFETDGEAESTTPEAEEQETEQRPETHGEVDDIKATEAARRRAEELDVDLEEVEGSGSNGQITVQDVKRAAESES